MCMLPGGSAWASMASAPCMAPSSIVHGRMECICLYCCVIILAVFPWQALEAYQESQRMNPENKDLTGKIRELTKLSKRTKKAS